MIQISIQNSIKSKLPIIRLHCLEASVKILNSNDEFWEKEVEKNLNEILGRIKLSDIAELEANKSTREAYKKLGKDPSRYRPSAEALLRRVVNGKGLYRVNNVVDCLNLLSVVTGFSIGGFDIDKIEGKIELGIGDASTYEAIGRGELNIEFIPALRDEKGFFGTPTSDSIRTMVKENTSKFLMVYYDFSGEDDFTPIRELTMDYLSKYANASDISSFTIE